MTIGVAADADAIYNTALEEYARTEIERGRVVHELLGDHSRTGKIEDKDGLPYVTFAQGAAKPREAMKLLLYHVNVYKDTKQGILYWRLYPYLEWDREVHAWIMRTRFVIADR